MYTYIHVYVQKIYKDIYIYAYICECENIAMCVGARNSLCAIKEKLFVQFTFQLHRHMPNSIQLTLASFGTRFLTAQVLSDLYWIKLNVCRETQTSVFWLDCCYNCSQIFGIKKKPWCCKANRKKGRIQPQQNDISPINGNNACSETQFSGIQVIGKSKSASSFLNGGERLHSLC